ncbi:MAG: hypothetical protein Rubg2KO_19390 [Rubricoccaceae bacterium]
MRRLSVLAVALCLAAPAIAQRQLTTPRVSPHARTMQTIGMTDLAVDYHRPAVSDRAIWGELVPYGEIWRAGANENTTFEASTAIQVEGAALPAGRYGLHTIPGEREWTIIFSSMADAWGSYFYDDSEDVLRVTVAPTEAPMQERLSYGFDDPDLTSTTLVLRWERLAVPIRITADTPAIVLANMEQELHGTAGFFPEGWDQIATFALDHNLRTEDALAWAERSIQRSPMFSNQMTKARALEALGRPEDAQALRAAALAVAEESDVDAYVQARRRAGQSEEATRVQTLFAERDNG